MISNEEVITHYLDFINFKSNENLAFKIILDAIEDGSYVFNPSLVDHTELSKPSFSDISKKLKDIAKP